MLGQGERAPERTTAVSVGTDRATRTARVLLLAVPVAMILVLGWSRRWLNEDAYINLRVVDHVFAGNGPVFNAGERPIRDLLDAVNEPLTVGRFFSNMWNSVDLTRQHVPSDPRAAPTC